MSTTLIAAAATADHWHDGPPPFWPVFPLLWLAFFATAVTVAITVRRRSCGYGPQRAGEARLAERYAAGELTDEEYRARRAVLREKA
ncbi:SHOCT domain-containing protein [Nocardioides sp. MH1]|uniref:SHOCT domain-containing protein n=1 Tax=Nocardioides sp. MH1 TaxID=3242490 RepID=UPI0035219F9E